jgi:peptidoglycan hydrolase-like protein with peptidoglycan-binding domain
MAQRRYTGWDRNASGRRAGTEKMISIINYLSDGGLWNNGSWGVRSMRGKSNPSVHGTGRACDLSWRGGQYGGFGDHKKAKVWVDFLTQHATELELEAIFDYYPAPYGTGYKCDRDYTIRYTSKAFSGAPYGDWIHLEVSPKVADDPDFFERTFTRLIDGITIGDINDASPVDDQAIDVPGPEDFPGHLIDAMHEHKDEVKAVQSPLGVKVDGELGPKSMEAVNRFQQENGLDVVEGVDQATWEKLFGKAEAPPYPGKEILLGAKGDAVRAIQAKVDAHVDGEFGPKTEEAVKAWQTASGLKPDGRVGPKTWAKLFG